MDGIARLVGLLNVRKLGSSWQFILHGPRSNNICDLSFSQNSLSATGPTTNFRLTSSFTDVAVLVVMSAASHPAKLSCIKYNEP